MGRKAALFESGKNSRENSKGGRGGGGFQGATGLSSPFGSQGMGGHFEGNGYAMDEEEDGQGYGDEGWEDSMEQ